MPTLHRELTQINLHGNVKGTGNGIPKVFEGTAQNGATTGGGNSNKFPSINIPTGGAKEAAEDPVICKLEPFNICYRLDSNGNMHPLGDRRPVRLIRVYK